MEQRWRLAKKVLGGAIQFVDRPSPHVWLAAPATMPNFAQSCRAAGVEVVPAEVFMVKPSAFEGIRISLSAAPTRAELKIALLRIQRLLAEA